MTWKFFSDKVPVEPDLINKTTNWASTLSRLAVSAKEKWPIRKNHIKCNVKTKEQEKR